MTLLCVVLHASMATACAGETELDRFLATKNQCAAWAVYSCCSIAGKPVTVEWVNQRLPPEGTAKSLEQVVAALNEAGVPVVATLSRSLPPVASPGVVVVKEKAPKGGQSFHFLAVAGWDAERVVLVDGHRGSFEAPLRDFLAAWTGHAALVPADGATGPPGGAALWVGGCLVAGGIILRRIPRGAVAGATAVLMCGAAGCSDSEAAEDGVPIEVVGGAERLLSPGTDSDGGSRRIGTAFTLRNRSPRKIDIVASSSSCGCSKWEVPNPSIPPHGELTIPVTLQRSPSTAASGVLTLTTSAREQPQIFLRVAVKASAEVPSLTGKRIEGVARWRKVHGVWSARADCYFEAMEPIDSPPWIVGGTIDLPGAKVEVDRTYSNRAGDAARAGYKVSIQWAPTSFGWVTRPLTLLPGVSGRDPGSISANLHIPPLDSLAPSTLDLEATRGGTIRRTVFANVAASDLHVASETPKWLRVSVSPSGVSPDSPDQTRWRLDINVLPDVAPAGRCQFELVLAAGDKSLRLPVALTRPGAKP